MNKRIPIEDNPEDIISKAQSGLGIADGDLADLARIDRNAIRQLRKGVFNADAARAIAPHLGLNPDALVALAQGDTHPDEIKGDGLAQFNTHYPVPGYEEMTVNAYLVWDPATGEAAAFDTGANADQMIDTLRRKSWKLTHILLTHTHGDHIQDLEKLQRHLQPGGGVYVHAAEQIAGATSVLDGQTFDLGTLKIVARETSGHSPGGTSYLITGLERPVAIVGDALFAGSIGGIRAHYHQALDMIRERILALDPETIICPGHGPMTTVAEERLRNPFFA